MHRTGAAMERISGSAAKLAQAAQKSKLGALMPAWLVSVCARRLAGNEVCDAPPSPMPTPGRRPNPASLHG